MSKIDSVSPTTLLIMQGAAVTLQIINSGLGNVLPHTQWAPFLILCVAAIMGGFQTVVQHLGNQSKPNNGANGAIVSKEESKP